MQTHANINHGLKRTHIYFLCNFMDLKSYFIYLMNHFLYYYINLKCMGDRHE